MSPFRIASFAATLLVLVAASGVHAQEGDCGKNHYILAERLPVWVPTGNLNVPRFGHTATLLPDGKVLVAGGMDAAFEGLASAELYDPATGLWTLTGSLVAPRRAHTATLLPGGKVLVVGGDSIDAPPERLGLTGSAELYDPISGSWSPTGSLVAPRGAFTATLLATGKVLVAGGVGDSDEILDSAELYDPATGTWGVTGNLVRPRLLHTATPLLDGRILVVAGWDDDWFQTGISAVELYDPLTGLWSSAADLGRARAFHTATRLQDGRVVVAGGYGGNPAVASFDTAELFDPIGGTWTSVGNLGFAREGHTATLLRDGQVLVAGGFDWSSRLPVVETEAYDAASATWTETAIVGSARRGHTATLLPDGEVLVAGGAFVSPSFESNVLGSAERYRVVRCVRAKRAGS
jgi:hypothetical protein